MRSSYITEEVGAKIGGRPNRRRLIDLCDAVLLIGALL